MFCDLIVLYLNPNFVHFRLLHFLIDCELRIILLNYKKSLCRETCLKVLGVKKGFGICTKSQVWCKQNCQTIPSPNLLVYNIESLCKKQKTASDT